MFKTNFSLSAEQLAGLFTQLKSLESAGLPAFSAFALLIKSETKLKKPLALMLQKLKSGLSISEAGFRAGIFNDTHKTLIHAAEASGNLEEVYGQLAHHYSGLSIRIRKVKSRLYFPALTLVISLFVQPLPAFVSSEINGIDYLQLSLGRFLVIGMGILLLTRLPNILCNLGLETAWHHLQLKVPVVSKWIIKRQINEFLFILAMMLEGGLAFSETLPKAVASIKNSCLREQFIPALTMLGRGASVTDTLMKVPIINGTILHVVNSSEQSGKLASGILHFTQLEAEAIQIQDDALAEWLPRLVYGFIVIWLAYSILGNQLAPVVPSNL